MKRTLLVDGMGSLPIANTQNLSKEERCSAFVSFLSCTCFTKGVFLIPLLLAIQLQVLGQLQREWISETYSINNVSYEQVKTIVLDAEQNVLVVGFTTSWESENRNVLLRKYDAAGELLWSRVFDDTMAPLVPVTVEVGGNGDIYFLSSSATLQPAPVDLQLKVSRLAADGQGEWQTVYEATGIRGTDLQVNDQEQIFVTGTAPDYNNGRSTSLTTKLTTSGEVVWQQAVPDVTGGRLALTPDGHLLLAAQVFINDFPLPDAIFVKFDGVSGDQLFSRIYSHQYNGTTGYEEINKILVDDVGAAYVVLSSERAIINEKELVLVKLSPDGEISWFETFADGFYTFYKDAVLRNQDEVWILGNQQRFRFIPESFITSINSSGQQLWTQTYSTSPAINHVEQRFLNGLAVSPDGRVAATGFYTEFTYESPCCPTFLQNPALYTVVFDDQGNITDEAHIGGDTGELVGLSLAFDEANNLFVSGRSAGGAMGEGSTAFLVKYKSADACNIPVVASLSLPPGAHPVGKQIRTTAYLESDSLPELLNPRWVWGDGTSSISYHAPGDRHVTGEHTYTEAGIYTIGLDFNDTCLEPLSEDYTQQLVIFDPNAGFVTGGGWFIPANQLGLPGGGVKVQFNFNIRYQQGANGLKPSGSTTFKLANAIRFESTGYDWLVVNGDYAYWQGSGKINGYGDFGFIVSVMDAGPGKHNKADRLRVRIWDKRLGNKLYYDSHAAKGDIYFLPEQGAAIGGGNIVIHRNGRLQADKQDGLIAGLDENPAKGLVAYPNPSSGIATLRFELRQEGNYSLALYDLKGGLVQSLRQGSALPDEPVKVQVDATALPKGIYLVRLITDDETRSVKMIIQ